LPIFLRRILSLSLATLALAPALGGTWSIIIVDTRTGEIAIASASCVRADLRTLAPVVLVGKGAAAVQSFADLSGYVRAVIREGMARDMSPSQILAYLAGQDPAHQSRQYGIVDTRGRVLTFTGSKTGAWTGGLTGKVGTLVYAIQGNVLTGQPVIKKAEAAIRNTTGDLAAKLMAAMEAARSMGGDGRCSCSTTNPPGCGSPPKSFTKSAESGFMIVARHGDGDGACNRACGCAAGTYYMNLSVVFQQATDPDPVLQLRKRYDSWRKSLVGRPDHHLSSTALSAPDLPADGTSTAVVTVALRDLAGTPLTGSQAKFTVRLDLTSTATLQIGAVTAKGNGVYAFPVRAGSKAGTARLRIVVDDGGGRVLLSPTTDVTLRADPLWVFPRAVSAATGGKTRFVLQGGTARKQRAYLLVGSASGSQPGIRVSPNLTIPVNPDPVFYLLLQYVNTPVLPAGLGVLDGSGRAEAAFVAPPAALGPLKGLSLTFAWASLSPVDFASNPVKVAVTR
jgi:uncharacterized Ntn-hydrolase superfamily protein